MSETDDLAPGCFGSALTYNASHPICSSCIFAAKCAPESLQRLENLRDQFGIKMPKRKTLPVSSQVTEEGLQMVGEVPVKVAEFLQRCDRSGIKITEALRQGRNPFEKKPAFMKLACHLLLNMPDGINLPTLKKVFIKKMEWTELTANSYTIQATQTLLAVGAARQEGLRLCLIK